MARPKPSKITKSASSSSSNRTTKHHGRSTSAGSPSQALRNMVGKIDEVLTGMEDGMTPMDEDMRTGALQDHSKQVGACSTDDRMETDGQEAGDTTTLQGKGKARLVEAETVIHSFPILDLPAEIRLEIYRMCLIRPYKVLLSKADRSIHAGALAKGTASSDEGQGVPLGPDLDPTSTPSTFVPAATNNGSSNSRKPPPAASSSSSGGAVNSQPIVANSTSAPRTIRRPALKPAQLPTPSRAGADPLNINLLRTCKQVYKEARDVLYSENVFDVNVYTAVSSLAALHQRSRRHIKHIELEIPTYTEILEHFSEVVRLSLRYCAGLRKLVIHTPFTLPGADGGMGSTNTTVYANGFDILRWLPQNCQVILAGNTNPEIDAVVGKHLRLAKLQDKMGYARRQLISNEAELPAGHGDD